MAKLYWAWARDCGPGLGSIEIPLAVCERELELDAAQPLSCNTLLSSAELQPDGVVLEVRAMEGVSSIAAGLYRLAERRSDPVIQKLVRMF